MTMMRQTRRDYAAKLLEQPIVCLADVHKKRADVEYLIGMYPKANEDYTRAKSLYTSAGCLSGCGEVDHSMGNVSIDMGLFDKAEDCYLKALKIFALCKEELEIAKCYKELGKVCVYREKTDAALEYYQKAMYIYDNLEYIKGRVIIAEYLADLYRTKGEYEKALSAVNQLREYYKGSMEYGSLCRIDKLAGNIYMEKGDVKLSKTFLNNAYQYATMTGESAMAMYILCDLGAAYYNTKEFETACGHFELCLSLAEKMDSAYMKAINMVNLADANNKMGNMKQSREYINKATTINHNIGGLRSEIQRIQAEIDQKEGGQEKGR
jgi:two-component system sensor histidine kinase/response regulator